MRTVKVRRVGNELGVVLPDDVLARLGMSEGDTVCLSELPDGFQVARLDPDFERQMKLARETMSEREGVLRDLAK